MVKFSVFAILMLLACSVQASWYWPVGSDDDDKKPPRLSKLMEPATKLIDDASDLAGDGRVDEAVAKYREALDELDRIETENPERAKTTEFATLRNKRAYVNAAIDSMLLSQVKENAKAVAVSDTTELERKLAEERKTKSAAKTEERESAKARDKGFEPARPLTRREQVIEAIAKGDYAVAGGLIQEMLNEKPNGVMALNLKAMMEIRQGKVKEAERTLDQATTSNPRNYHAYYNLAILTLQKDPENKSTARRYYETGRAMGNGPEDLQLEALLK